jgi:hypothetical protein
MVKGTDNTKRKDKTYKNIIERDVELIQGAGFGGTPEHIQVKNKKKKEKRTISHFFKATPKIM